MLVRPAGRVDGVVQGIGGQLNGHLELVHVIRHGGEVRQRREIQRIAPFHARRPDRHVGPGGVGPRLRVVLVRPIRGNRVVRRSVSETAQVVLFVDDDGGNSGQGRFFHDPLDQDRFAGTRSAENENVPGQIGPGNGDRLARLSPDLAAGRGAASSPTMSPQAASPPRGPAPLPFRFYRTPRVRRRVVLQESPRNPPVQAPAANRLDGYRRAILALRSKISPAGRGVPFPKPWRQPKRWRRSKWWR